MASAPNPYEKHLYSVKEGERAKCVTCPQQLAAKQVYLVIKTNKDSRMADRRLIEI